MDFLYLNVRTYLLNFQNFFIKAYSLPSQTKTVHERKIKV